MTQKPKPSFPNAELIRFQTAISRERLRAHERRSTDNEVDILSTYLWNIALSEAIYPVLHNFELAIRNSFHDAISRSFHKDWLLEVDLSILNEREAKTIETSILKLRKNGKDVSKDNLVSELTLGFWTSLTHRHHERPQNLYPKLFRDPEFLPHIPKKIRTRSTLSDRLTSIGKLRNKIFHHNPIWKDKDLDRKHNEALEVIHWISPMLYEITKTSSRFSEVYSEGWNEANKTAKHVAEKYL